MARTEVNHRDIVKRLLDSKAVDFNAIGKAVSELGPELALLDEPGDHCFCGTMRLFVHLYRFPPPVPTPVEVQESE
jgi:hypothetical protein